MVVGRVVDAAVVRGAQQSAVGQVGGSTQCAGVVVVGVAEPGRGLATHGGAALVADGQRDALGPGEATAATTLVQDLPPATEDDGNDPGLTRQAAGGV